jgi:hypothetical protein
VEGFIIELLNPEAPTALVLTSQISKDFYTLRNFVQTPFLSLKD